MRPGNLASRLPRRRRAGRPMDRYDGLPPVLRAWLAAAILPWSASSVQRLWPRLLQRAGGDVAGALHLLDQAEDRLIRRDAQRVWGAGHPASQQCAG